MKTVIEKSKVAGQHDDARHHWPVIGKLLNIGYINWPAVGNNKITTRDPNNQSEELFEYSQ